MLPQKKKLILVIAGSCLAAGGIIIFTFVIKINISGLNNSIKGDISQFYLNKEISKSFGKNFQVEFNSKEDIKSKIEIQNNIAQKRIIEKSYQIEFVNKKLIIETKNIYLTIDEGSITYIKDKSSGEAFVNIYGSKQKSQSDHSLIGFVSKGFGGELFKRQPGKSTSVVFSKIGNSNFQLSYYPLYSNYKKFDCQLIINICIEPENGEVILQITGIESNPELFPVYIDIPIDKLSSKGVILGSGAKYSRSDRETEDQTSHEKWGLYSPTMAVVQGENSTIAVWSETTKFSPEYIRIIHKIDYDQLILHSEQDPKQYELRKIVSAPWRIGAYQNWVKSAKRWREQFEERTNARPLWENTTQWVKKIHAVYYDKDLFIKNNNEKYRQLASIVNPERMLYFIWNGDRIVLFGDHTLVDQIKKPNPEEIQNIRRIGWRLILYHPYNLIYSTFGALERLDFLRKRDWLPKNYEFNPEYIGKPQSWTSYWDDVKTSYFKNFPLDIIHPGSKKFQDYLLQNFKGYCLKHCADGAYFDILGADHISLFPNSIKIIEGQDYILGEINAIKNLRKELPEKAIMSEYQSTWILPYIFFSWEGPETHVFQSKRAQTQINHPLRAALIGSYCWSKENIAESNAENDDEDIISAFFASLPQIILDGEEKISKKRALFSQARAKLFCEKELFHDIPDVWEDNALAYYRSNTGNWFMIKKDGSKYAYIEKLSNGKEFVHLLK
jgi:hypothetical protein